MTGADEHLTAGVIIDWTTGMRAGGIVGHELPVVETHEDTRVVIGGDSEVDRAIFLDGTDLGNRGACASRNGSATGRGGSRGRGCTCGSGRISSAWEKVQCIPKPRQDEHTASSR